MIITIATICIFVGIFVVIITSDDKNKPIPLDEEINKFHEKTGITIYDLLNEFYADKFRTIGEAEKKYSFVFGVELIIFLSSHIVKYDEEKRIECRNYF